MSPACWAEVAEIEGRDAAAWAKAGPPIDAQLAQHYAYTFARKAAHAAFLSCPSLRG